MLCKESSQTCGQERTALAHSDHVIKGFLVKNNAELVRHPPYSPDLAPCDFWLFPKLKTTLKRTRFQSRKDIMKKQRRGSGAFQRRSSRGVSKSVRGAVKSVCICKGSILKEIK